METVDQFISYLKDNDITELRWNTGDLSYHILETKDKIELFCIGTEEDRIDILEFVNHLMDGTWMIDALETVLGGDSHITFKKRILKRVIFTRFFFYPGFI